MYTQHPILTDKHRIVEIFADLLKKKNWNITWSLVFRPFAVTLIQWGKKVFSQPPIVQVLPLKKMREAWHFHHRYTSTMRDKIRKKNPENHIVGFLKNLFANYRGKFAVTLIYLTQVLSISSDHPWDGSTPSFESSCVWLYWLDLIRKATHLSI